MNMLTNILLTLILLLICALSGIFWRFWVKFNSLENNIISFISPLGDGKPSNLAMTAQVFADMLGRSCVAQLKTTFMGIQSGQSRAERAIQADLVQDTISSSPLGSILTAFPSLKKTLRRNPQLLDMALSAISSKIGNQLGGNGSSESPKFNL